MFNTFSLSLLGLLLAAFASATANAQNDAGELEQWHRDLDVSRDAPRAGGWDGFVGAGVIAVQGAYGDDRTTVLPLASVSYKDTLYWRSAGGGAWLLTSDDRRARGGIAVRFRRGYDPDDDAGLDGMAARDTSLEVGVNASIATRAASIGAAYYSDISGTTDGESAMVSISHPIRMGARVRLVPSVGAEWFDANVVSYYYGVRADEATATRPAYEGRATVNVRAGLSAGYALTRNWSLLGGVSYTHLGAGITDSPIVINDRVAALYLGAGWRF